MTKQFEQYSAYIPMPTTTTASAMTDNRTTEKLCKLLEERGLSCQTHLLRTSWCVGSKLYTAVDNLDGTLTVGYLTPEQVIAATLWSERENALKELVHDMWREITTCPDYVTPPCMTTSICERVRNLEIGVNI